MENRNHNWSSFIEKFGDSFEPSFGVVVQDASVTTDHENTLIPAFLILDSGFWLLDSDKIGLQHEVFSGPPRQDTPQEKAGIKILYKCFTDNIR